MGAAFEVYNQPGYGMAEEVHQQSFEVELPLRDIPFLTKCELSVWYKGRELQTRYIPDLFVFQAIVVELKAVSQLLPEHDAQLFNDMRIARQPVGYLIISAGRMICSGSDSCCPTCMRKEIWNTHRR